MDSSSISTCEYFHFSSEKSPFDTDLNSTYCEDILDTEVITNFVFKYIINIKIYFLQFL